MPVFSAIVAGLVGAYGASENSASQRASNRTNVKLQREQQAWETNMSNTAVQRRADDIEKAGGNRALAFTTGASASTPTIQPARVESDRKGDIAIQGANSAFQLMQMRQMAAQTQLTTAQARQASVEADIREGIKKQEMDTRLNYQIEKHDWDDLKTEIERTKRDMTGRQLAQFEQMAPELLKEAKARAKMGTLNAEALENIAKLYGIEGGKFAPLLSLILRIFNR